MCGLAEASACIFVARRVLPLRAGRVDVARATRRSHRRGGDAVSVRDAALRRDGRQQRCLRRTFRLDLYVSDPARRAFTDFVSRIGAGFDANLDVSSTAAAMQSFNHERGSFSSVPPAPQYREVPDPPVF
jgi:hypothetical protein